MLTAAQGYFALFAGWALIGLGMGMGLYDAAFARLAGIYEREARGPITGIRLIAGFASTVGWPLTGVMLAQWGWREACLGWALLHICVALPLHLILPQGNEVPVDAPPTDQCGPIPTGIGASGSWTRFPPV